MKIAVIGAGIAGLTAAKVLREAGHQVTVFDKSKGTGGRLSSRSFENGWIDHGAPYFSSELEYFSQFLDKQLPSGVRADWRPKVSGELGVGEKLHSIGVPRNSAITRGLLDGINFQPSTRIARIAESAEGWQLFNDGESLLGVWPTLLLAIPAPQARALVSDQPSLLDPLAAVKMEPCWVAAIRNFKVLQNQAEVAVYQQPVIRRIVNNSAKPGRNNANIYLVQATKDWSEQYLEESSEWVGLQILENFAELVSTADSELLFVHRWRYAFAEQTLGLPCLWDSRLRLGVCGDWCLGRRVEDAWQSGAELAARVLKNISEEQPESRTT